MFINLVKPVWPLISDQITNTSEVIRNSTATVILYSIRNTKINIAVFTGPKEEMYSTKITLRDAYKRQHWKIKDPYIMTSV